MSTEMMGCGRNIPLAAGKHSFEIRVFNLNGLPAAYIESDVCATDGSRYTLDENMKKIPVGFEKNHDMSEKNPENFIFSYKKILPVSREEKNGGVLFDFGREIFGFLFVSGAKKSDRLHISYGESVYEALDTEYSILFEDA